MIDKNMDPDLCSEGYQEIIALAKTLDGDPRFHKLDAIFHSPTVRTRETARVLLEHATKIKIPPFRAAVEDLHEMDMGDMSGQPYNYPRLIKIQLRKNSNSHRGESGLEFKIRAIKAYKRLVAAAHKTGWQHIMIVTHNGWLVAVLRLHLRIISRFKYKFKNTETISLEYQADNVDKQPSLVFHYDPSSSIKSKSSSTVASMEDRWTGEVVS